MSDEATRLARMETTLEMMKEQLSHLVSAIAIINTVQTELSYTREELGRAFGRIQTNEAGLRGLEETCRTRDSALQKKVDELDSRVKGYVLLGTGIGVGVSGAFAAVAWIINNNIVSALQAVAKVSGH